MFQSIGEIMRLHCRLAAVSLLALAVAACGEPAEEADDPVAEVEETMNIAEPAVSDEAPAGDEGDAAEGTAGEEEAEASPTPTPTPTATRTPTPTPTQAAAMDPPSSFTQCAVCHSVEPGENGIGPTLAGVFGRRAAAVPGFNYSDAMEDSGLTWNQATLNRYLADPNGVVPGTTMALPGVPAADRTAIIDYLKTL